MKCPNCKFISSNKRDVCPECLIDLRPHKQTLGIPISKPNASIQELRAELEHAPAGGASKTASKPAAAAEAPAAAAPVKAAESAPSKPSSSWLSKLFGKKEQTGAPNETPEPKTAPAPAPKSAPTPSAQAVQQKAEVQTEMVQTAPIAPAQPEPETHVLETSSSSKQPAQVTSVSAEAEAGEPIQLDLEEEAREVPYEEDTSPLSTLDDEPIDPEAIDPEALDPEALEPDLWRQFLAEMSQTEASNSPETEDGISAAGPISVAEQVEQIRVVPEEDALPVEVPEPAAEAVIPEQDDDAPLFPTPIDPIESFAKAIESGLLEATAAADELAQAALESGAEATESEEDDELGLIPKTATQLSSPTVTPEVMEFDDEDDALLEQQLDEMIGDLIVDVAPVKQEKKPVPQVPQSVLVDDDLEISFEFEVEGEESASDAAGLNLQTQAQSAEADVLEDLLSAFNELDSAAGKIAVAAASGAGEEVAERQQQVQQSLSAAEIRSARLKQLSQALGVAPDDLLNELTEIVIEAHGLDPADLKKHDVLGALEKELDEQLQNLQAEGTTFYAAKEPEEEEQTKREVQQLPQQIAGTDQVSLLEAELESELEALAAEGLTVYSDSALDRNKAETELLADIATSTAEPLKSILGTAADVAQPQTERIEPALVEETAELATTAALDAALSDTDELSAALAALGASVEELSAQDQCMDLDGDAVGLSQTDDETQTPDTDDDQPPADGEPLSIDDDLSAALAALNASADELSAQDKFVDLGANADSAVGEPVVAEAEPEEPETRLH